MVLRFSNRTLPETLALAFASLGGAGFFPKMPGTFGSAVALLLLLLPTENIHLFLLVSSILAFVLGLFCIPILCDDNSHDPAFVVIDEAAAMWLVLASPFVPHTWLWVAIGFLLFRVFDIWKPFPIKLIEQKKGSFAVMMDDIVAALYALACLHLLYYTYLASPLVMRFLTNA